MDFSQVGTCVAIVVICYLAGIGAKLIPVIKDRHCRWHSRSGRNVCDSRLSGK